MKLEKKVIVNILWIVIGTILIGLSFAGIVDAFWNGMGTGLLVVGVLHLVKFYRLDKNPAYREKNEIELNDERNRFLRNKAWAWAGYLFVMLAAVCSIIFKIADQELLSFAASGSVCIILVLYCISFWILKRKY
jgi:hypothetical protein